MALRATKKAENSQKAKFHSAAAFLPTLPGRRLRVLGIQLVQGFRRSLRLQRVRHILRADPFIELLRGHIA
jgi:hypothetical protein